MYVCLGEGGRAWDSHVLQVKLASYILETFGFMHCFLCICWRFYYFIIKKWVMVNFCGIQPNLSYWA